MSGPTFTGGDGTKLQLDTLEEDLLQNAMQKDKAPTWMTIEEVEASGYTLADFDSYQSSHRRLESGVYVPVYSVGREIYLRSREGARRLGASVPGPPTTGDWFK